MSTPAKHAVLEVSFQYPFHVAVFVQLREFRYRRTNLYSILPLLLQLHRTECADDHDRIFAFLGISNDVETQSEEPIAHPNYRREPQEFQESQNQRIRFTPDYRCSTEETYLRFAPAALRSSNPFDILHCASAFRQPLDLVNFSNKLPSWVPDWRIQPRYCPLMKALKYRAGMSKDDKRRKLLATESQLTVTGVRLATIDRLLHPYPPQLDHWASVDYVGYCDQQSGSAQSQVDMHQDRVGIKPSNETCGALLVDVQPEDKIVIFFRRSHPICAAHCWATSILPRW